MTRPHLSRRSVLAFGVSVTGAALAVGVSTPWQSRNVEAQVDPALAGTEVAPEQYDPALVGTDPALSATDSSLVAPDTVPVAAATPVITPEPSIPSPTWVPTDAGMSTSLGGSDIAVASEGGSHQVDAPKRKANKVRGGKKRP